MDQEVVLELSKKQLDAYTRLLQEVRQALHRCVRHVVSCPYVLAKGECNCGVADGYTALIALEERRWR